MRRTKEAALETRKAILKVALDCFAKRGYSLTTFSDIAQRIHLTKGAVFWHFKTKEDLLAEIIVREHEIYMPLPDIGSATSTDDILNAFLDWTRAIIKSPELRQFFVFVMIRVEWSEALKAKLRTKLEAFMIRDPYERLEAQLLFLQERGVIRQDVSARQITIHLFSIFFGTHREVLLHKREMDIVETVKSGLMFILQSIRRQ